MNGAQRTVDVLGVGVGPFNLSLAALLDPLTEVDSAFFEMRPDFSWHPGFLFPWVTIQNSFLKDLVTLADPTSRHSFLQFLHEKGRTYRFINAGYPKVKRHEYNQYLQWVCSRLPGVHFDCRVESVELVDGQLLVTLGNEELAKSRFGSTQILTRNLVLGTGRSAAVPDFVFPHLGPTVFHSSHFLDQDRSIAGKRVAVVGSGQSGGETVTHLVSRHGDDLPASVTWITKGNFLPLDDSPFTEEIFTPNYSDYFFALPRPMQDRLVVEQRLASDGVSMDILQRIYRRCYELEYLEGAGRRCHLMPETRFCGLNRNGEGWTLELHNQLDDHPSTLDVDVVILSTGFEYRVPPCLDPIRHRIPVDPKSSKDNEFDVRQDFSIDWDGPDEVRIYVQNAARHCRGVPDPNLSLMAWRSATIINSLVGHRVYQIDQASSVFQWDLVEPGSRVLTPSTS